MLQFLLYIFYYVIQSLILSAYALAHNKVYPGIESSFLLEPSGAFPPFDLGTGPDQTLNIF